VEALPGFDIANERTVLGTFWRDTAVEQEEIEYFATGHPLVEALFGFLRDGPYGRNGARHLELKGQLPARGLEVLFHVVPPDAPDTSPGARVPSRHLARFLDATLVRVAVVRAPDGAARAEPTLLGPLLDHPGRALKGSELGLAFPQLASFVEVGVAEATRVAEADLASLRERAREAVEDERDQTLLRIRHSLEHQGVPAGPIEQVLARELAFYDALEVALDGTRLVLDSACAFVVNR
jgi:ATP-dependent helicase HepA